METKDNLIKVAITHGDINGIGYEIIVKAFAHSGLQDMCIPIVYGSSKIASYHKKTLELKDFNFNLVKSADQAKDKRVNIINITENEIKIDLGKSTELSGSMALLSLENVVEELKKNNVDVLVTAPINKKNIQSDKFNFPGHTEFLANCFNTKNYLMLMVSDNLRVGTITGHVPLKDVPSLITKELIIEKVKILNNSLIRDFGIRKPKIALLGLNPHAGDCGLLGKEEQDIIKPAIEDLFDMGIMAMGPYPADGFFASGDYKNFDGILSMFHDQGLIPFKTLAFSGGVNYTAGLPIIRTSPAHGTAYEIAGKDMASGESFKEAVLTAISIYNKRKEFDELNKNPLLFSKLDDDS